MVGSWSDSDIKENSMSMQDGYLDRMAARIAEFERALRGSSAEQLDDRRRRDLEAGLATVKRPVD